MPPSDKIQKNKLQVYFKWEIITRLGRYKVHKLSGIFNFGITSKFSLWERKQNSPKNSTLVYVGHNFQD